MNDFLAMLVARSRGTEVVRPRLPSRFEASTAPVPQADDATQAIAVPTLVMPAVRDEARRPSAEAFARDVDVALERTQPVAASRPSVATDRPSQAVSPAVPSRVAATESIDPPRRARSEPQAMSTRPAQPVAPRLATAEAASTAAAREPVVSEAVPAVKPSARPAETASPRGDASSRSIAPVVPPAASPQARPLPRPALPVAARRAAPAETTVHVSIGRVEVRLHGEPGRARARSVDGPAVMSLDDYLRSRAGR